VHKLASLGLLQRCQDILGVLSARELEPAVHDEVRHAGDAEFARDFLCVRLDEHKLVLGTEVGLQTSCVQVGYNFSNLRDQILLVRVDAVLKISFEDARCDAVLCICAVLFQHVRHRHVVVFGVGVAVADAREHDRPSFPLVDLLQRRANAALWGSAFGYPLLRYVWAEEKRQKSDDHVDFVRGGGNGLLKTVLAEPTKRSHKIAHDFDRDFLPVTLFSAVGQGSSFAAFDFEGWVVHSQPAGWPGFLVFTVSATPCIIHLGVAEACVNGVFEVRIRFRREGCVRACVSRCAVTVAKFHY